MLHAEDRTSTDRVRHSTAPEVNHEIDRRTNSNIQRYANSSEEAIHERIEELDQEWDIERALEVNASTLALTGLVLGVTVDRKWLRPTEWLSQELPQLDPAGLTSRETIQVPHTQPAVLHPA